MLSQNLGNITHNWSTAAVSDTTGGKCAGLGLVRDLSDNLYVVGTFSGVADFDPSAATYKLSSATTTDDLFLAKYSPTGNFIYAKRIGGTGTKGFGGLAFDKAGYLYVCGGFNGTTDFDPSASTYTLASTGNTDDGFIAKYDLNGNLIYVNQIGALGSEFVSSVVINNGGNVFVTGNFQGTSDFDPSPFVYNITAIGGADIFFAKYTSTGNLVYVLNAGGTSSEYGASIAIGKNSAIHITGYFSGVADFDPSAGVATRTSVSSSQDVFIAKYDSAGNYVYAKSMGGAGVDQSYSIKADTAGAVYICGLFQGTADFNPAAAVYNLFTGNSQAGFVARYNSAGNFVYAQSVSNGFSNTNYACLNAVAIDKNKSAYVTGYLVTSAAASISTGSIVVAKVDSSGATSFYNTLPCFFTGNGRGICVDTATGKSFITGIYNLQVDADPSATVHHLNAPAFDCIVSSYDPFGNYIYANTLGTYFETGYIAPAKTRRDAAGNVYVVGTIKGSYNFDATHKLISSASSTTLGPGYSPSDIYFAKYNNAGTLLWSRVIGGPAIENGLGIAVNKSGAVYITGTYQTIADFDPSPAVYTLTTIGNTYNSFIARYDQNGNFVFAKPIGGSDAAFAFGIETDDSSHIYLSGDFRGTVDFDPSPATAALSSFGSSFNPQYDSYVARYDSLGNYQYVKQIGDAGNDGNTFITVDATGAIYVTGLFSGTVDFDLGPGVYSLSSSSGGNYFAKYTASGTLVYAKNIGGDVITSHKIDKLGNIYVAGHYSGTQDFDPSAAAVILSSPTNYSSYFAKYDPLGNYMLVKGFNTLSNSDVFIDADTLGAMYVSGTFYNTVDFDPSASVANLTSAGNRDGFLAKYSATGIYDFVYNFGGAFEDRCSPVLVSKDGGNILLAGVFTGNVDFDPSPALASLNSNTIIGSFIADYNSCMFPVNQTPFSALNYCESNSTTLTVQGVGATNWYATATSTLSLASGSVYATPLLSAGNYSYYIEGSNCTTGRAQITVSVNPTPTIAISGGFVCIGSSYTLSPTGAQTYTFSGGQAVVSPTSNSSYSVTGTSAFGCSGSNTAVANLTVLALPIVSALNDSLCSGQSLTLQVSGATSYTYSSGSGVVSPTVNTTYSITGTDAYGCVSSNTAVASVYVKPSPVVSVSNGTICPGNSYTFNPSGAVSYSYPAGGPVVSPVVSTTYSVTGTGTNSCFSTVTASVTVSAIPVISVNSGSICSGKSFTISPSGASSYSITGNNFVVSPSANTSYSVTGTSSLGCVSATPAIASVNVYSLPVVSAASGTMCQGGSYIILPAGALTYTYSSGSATVSPVATSIFSVTGTNGFGCVSSAANVTVIVSPLPTVTITSSSGTICSGSNVLLQAGGAASYTWSGGQTTPSIVVSPTVTTSYTVTGASSSGCTNNSTILQTVYLCTTIENGKASAISLLVYPNPNNGRFIIRSPQNGQLKIMDEIGRVIGNYLIEEGDNALTLPVDAANGIYFARIKLDKNEFNVKIIKQD